MYQGISVGNKFERIDKSSAEVYENFGLNNSQRMSKKIEPERVLLANSGSLVSSRAEPTIFVNSANKTRTSLINR